MQPLPVGTIPQADQARLSRVAGAQHGPMLSAGDALDILHRHKPKDAFLLLGYTMEDLQALSAAAEKKSGGGGGGGGEVTPVDEAEAHDAANDDEDGNEDTASPFGLVADRAAADAPLHAFGASQPLRGVGLVSFARFVEDTTLVDLPDAVAFAYICQTVPNYATFLRRCVVCLGHECGRLLGMARCVYGRCLMNGASHLAEHDARSVLPCPCDLKKIATTLDDAARAGTAGVERMPFASRYAQRERATHEFLSNHGFTQEAEACRHRLEAFASAEATADEVESKIQGEFDEAIAREMELAREAVRRDAAAAAEIARLDAAAAKPQAAVRAMQGPRGGMRGATAQAWGAARTRRGPSPGRPRVVATHRRRRSSGVAPRPRGASGPRPIAAHADEWARASLAQLLPLRERAPTGRIVVAEVARGRAVTCVSCTWSMRSQGRSGLECSAHPPMECDRESRLIGPF